MNKRYEAQIFVPMTKAERRQFKIAATLVDTHLQDWCRDALFKKLHGVDGEYRYKKLASDHRTVAQRKTRCSKLEAAAT